MIKLGVSVMQILNENTFYNETNNNISIITFVTDDCLPCKMTKNTLIQVENSTIDKSKMKYYMVNIINDINLTEQYNIEYTPTIIVMNEGHEIDRLEGTAPVRKTKEFIANSIKKVLL